MVKRILTLTVLSAFIFCMTSCIDFSALKVQTGSSTDGAVTWTFNEQNRHMSISGTTNTARPLTAADIPEVVAAETRSLALGSGITAVGDKCFVNFKKLITAEIPYTVTSLGKNIFDGCCVQNVLIDLNPDAFSAQGATYSWDANWAQNGNLRKITIGQYVEEIQKLIRESTHGATAADPVTIAVPYFDSKNLAEIICAEKKYVSLDLSACAPNVDFRYFLDTKDAKGNLTALGAARWITELKLPKTQKVLTVQNVPFYNLKTLYVPSGLAKVSTTFLSKAPALTNLYCDAALPAAISFGAGVSPVVRAY